MELSLRLKGFFMNVGVQRMLEQKDYRVLDMIFPIVYGYIYVLTDYAKAPRMPIVREIYISLMSRAVSGN